MDVIVQRYRPDTDDAPRMVTYPVPWTQDTSVLDALNYIKDNIDSSLTFRWSCRMAICGSCGFMLNGEPKLGCEQFLRTYAPGPLKIEPLANHDVERDLVVDLEPFMEKLASVEPYLHPDVTGSPEPGNLQTPAEMARYSQYAACINCMLCYAACPQVGLNPGFAGPAALALLHRWNADSRDVGWAARRDVANAEEGVWGCTLVGDCSTVCPKGVDPAHAINQNKVHSAADTLGLGRMLERKAPKT